MRARRILSDDDRWQAVLSRRQEADGHFFYAVRTTGIYCRPTCASRRPNRGNVEFFANVTAAERAGYRPCLRCRPTAASADERQIVAVRKACALLERTEETLSLGELAEEVGMSRSHFHRVFTKVVGLSPKEYADARRLERLQEELNEGRPITDAIFEAGYGSSSRVYESSYRNLGMTPAQYRQGGRGQEIRFATTETDLGVLVVAATEKGVCAIGLLDEEGDAAEELRGRFSSADLKRDDEHLGGWLQAVARFVELPERGLDLPLDIRGTAFQRQVWKALQEIPAGSTASYSEVAGRIGRPTAVRAVAGACAANPVALAVPCHRVVRGDGSPGGYRWGEKRKRSLLEREAAAVGGAGS
jgi:AraC family transcriptional regulator, regulatory protein of adaptative response / methylated-DNA-[protein]-cysteine methyltransferase